MLALSVRQPWAWAIFHGKKPIENRSQPLPDALLGRRTMVHASKTMTRDEYTSGAHAIHELTGLAVPTPERLVFGALIGAVTWNGQIEPIDAPPTMVGWHVTDQWGWLLASPVALPEPVYCSGARGFWKVPVETARQVWEAAGRIER